MKKISLLLFVAMQLLLTNASFSQDQCGFDSILSIQKNINPENFNNSILQVNDVINNYISNNPGTRATLPISGSADYVIPVVIHIVSDPLDPSMPYAQVESQIDALNTAFAKNYPSYNGQSNGVYSKDTKIQFCLAQTPMGPASWTNTAEPGVMRYYDAVRTDNLMTIASTNDLLDNLTHPTASGGTSANFPFSKYLNIWVVRSINGLCSGVQGYSLLPLYPATGTFGFLIDGVVIRADAFGDNSTGNTFTLQPHTLYGPGCPSAFAQRNQGKILVHEVGHYLNLFHTFQPDIFTGASCAGSTITTCNSEGDFICDTPPANVDLLPTFNCVGTRNTCSETYAPYLVNYADPTVNPDDQTENFLYYSYDACQNTFTEDQADRMEAYLVNYRSNLYTIPNQIATGILGLTGCLSPRPLSSIYYTTTLPNNAICVGTNVSFTTDPLPANSATSFNWTFPGGTPTASILSNPVVSYAAPGTYTVTLTTSDGITNSTSTLTISVSSCAPITDLGNANWYFGQYGAVSFNTGIPVANNSARVPQTIFAIEGCATQNDPATGSTVFYTNGIDIWNGMHQQFNTIPLGGHQGLIFNSVIGMDLSNSAAQVLSVPFPGNPNMYYLIIPPAIEDGYLSLKYAIIDMNLFTGGAQGSVVSQGLMTQSPLNTTGRNTESVTAIPHCNGRDYWIITHGVVADNRFYVYLLSPMGLTNSTLTSLVPNASVYFSFTNAFMLKASPDGGKIVLTSTNANSVATYSFNNSNGVISSQVLHSTVAGERFSNCSFSPLSGFVYATSQNFQRIIQFEILTSLWTPVVTTTDYLQQMQLGPDGKIYVVDYNTDLGAIDFPDVFATTAFTPSAVVFTTIPGSFPKYGLPNMIDALQPALSSPSFTITMVPCSTATFTVDPCWQNYTANWNFGDGSLATGNSVTHTFGATSTYNVTLTLSAPLLTTPYIITQPVSIINGPTTITGSTPVCLGEGPYIYTAPLIIGATYIWTTSSNGTIVGPSTGSQISVNWTSGTTGTVSVSIINGGCISNGTINVTVNPQPIITIAPLSPTICMGSSVILTASGASSYTWSPSTGLSCTTCASTTANLTATTTYTVTGIDLNGCMNTEVITVTVSPTTAPTVSVNSPTICTGQTTTLTATVSAPGGTFLWAPTTGLGCPTCISTSANPTATTTYTVTYTLGSCTNSASGTVTVNPLPTVTFGPIPNSCSGGTPVTLTTGSPSGGSYSGPFVSGGVFTPPTVTTSTSYTLTYTYTDAGTLCVNSATQTITVDPCIIPCSGCTYTLDALAPLGILSVSPTQYRVYCLNSDITISGTVTIALSEIRIAPTVTITVDPGSTLNIYGSHLYSCSDMWQGIVVKPGGRINVLYYATILTPGPGLTKRSPLIEDARIAIDIQAGSTITTGYILNVNTATFNRNEYSIKINGYISPISAYPFIFENSVFTCRDIPFSPFSINWPSTNTVKATYVVPTPLQTPYINTGTYSESNAASYLKSPFIPFPSPAASKSKVAIALNGVGDVPYSGATPSAWYEIKIGTIGMPAKFNVFDNHVVCIDAVNSNFTCVNNVFQNTIGSNNAGGIAINALAKSLNYRAQVIAGTPTGSFNNKFYDCNRSINTSNYFENTFKYCDVRSTPLSLTSQRGKDGFYVVTNRFRVVNMSDNKFYNIENAVTFYAIFGAYNINGVYVSPSTGGQYSGQVNVDRNEIAPHLPSYTISTQFVRSAIILGNSISSSIQVIPGNTVTSSSNNISKVHKGILTTSWFQKNIITNSNTITLVTDPFSGTATQFGVQHTNNTGATTYGNSINGNSVTGTGIFTNSNVRGIYTARCNKERVACNVVNGTTHGIQFASGHLNTKFDNNSMTNHMYGYVLSDNGIIDWQGSLSSPADNAWSGAWTGLNFKTATLSGSSAQFSKMYVRNGGLFNPNGSGFAASGLYGVEDYFYSGTSGTLLYVPTTTPPSLGCAVIVGGGGGGGMPGSAIALLEDIAQDNISHANNDAETKYINKNQLYRLLKADPSLTSSSVVLQNFYIASIPTVRETFASIEDDIASGDLVNGQSKTNALAPVNSIEDNYKTFFNAYLKYQTDTILSGDSIAIVNMANACPFTDGDVVYQARVLYNSIYSTNIYFEDNCPEVTERSFDQIKDKTTSSFDVLLYPNPNTGDFSLVPFSSDITELNITVMDVNGKIIFTKTINSGDRLFNLSLDSPNGIYMMFVNNPHTNESIVKRIVIQK